MLTLNEKSLDQYELQLTKDELRALKSLPIHPEPTWLQEKFQEISSYFGELLDISPVLFPDLSGLVFGGKHGGSIQLVDDRWVASGFSTSRSGQRQLVTSICLLCWLKAYLGAEPRLIISHPFEEAGFDLHWQMTPAEAENTLRVRNDLAFEDEPQSKIVSDDVLKAITEVVNVSATMSWPEMVLYFYAPRHSSVRYDVKEQCWFGESLTANELTAAVTFLCYLMSCKSYDSQT